MLHKPWYTSRTILGGIVCAIGKLADPSVLDLLSRLPLSESARAAATGVVQVAGGLVAIIGMRRAIGKPPTP